MLRRELAAALVSQMTRSREMLPHRAEDLLRVPSDCLGDLPEPADQLTSVVSFLSGPAPLDLAVGVRQLADF